MASANGLMADGPQHQKALEDVREVRELDLASLDVLPVCVYFISYRGCPRYIWANKQCLMVLDKTLEQLVATVRSSSTNPSSPAAGRAPFPNSGKLLCLPTLCRFVPKGFAPIRAPITSTSLILMWRARQSTATLLSRPLPPHRTMES